MPCLRAATTAAGPLAVLLFAATAAASDEVPTPSSDQRARSVSNFVIDGSVTNFVLDGSVTNFVLEGSVRPLESQRQEADEVVVSLASDILFPFASAQLPVPASARIAELVAPLPQGVPVTITGHTDSIGDPQSNLTLSQQRAQAVANAVTAARSDLQLTVEGRGATEPVAPNTRAGKDHPEGRALNRRVEVRFAR